MIISGLYPDARQRRLERRAILIPVPRRIVLCKHRSNICDLTIAHTANGGISHGALGQAIGLAGETRCQVELPLEISDALSNLVHAFEVPMTLAGGVEHLHQVLQQEHAVGKHVDSGTVDRDRINTMERQPKLEASCFTTNRYKLSIQL
jgi:hypothetical protein